MPLVHRLNPARARLGRASLEEMFRDYVELLPQYQGVPDLRGVAFTRAFSGFVPNWCARR